MIKPAARAIAVLAAALFLGSCSRGDDDDGLPAGPLEENEPNDSSAQATFLGSAPGTFSIIGWIDPAGDPDMFSVDALSGSDLTIDLGNLPADYNIALYDSNGVFLQSSLNAGTAPEQIVYSAVSEERYLVVVSGFGGAFDAGQNYVLTVAVTAPPSGPLDPGFDSDGIVQVNPDPGPDDWLNGGAVDSGHLYLAGGVGNGTSTNWMWRIEKRSLSDGSLDGAFGSGGVATSDPNPGAPTPLEEARAIAIDGSSMYVVGTEYLGGSDVEWRIEKRALSDGALDSGFDSDGVITTAISGGVDAPEAIAIDSTHLYILGSDETNGASDSRWRIEKRLLSTGALEGAFGAGGVQSPDPSAGIDEPADIALSGSSMYVVGSADTDSGDSRWRIERRLLTTGGLVGAFGLGGILEVDPTGSDDTCSSIEVDSVGGAIYLGGTETVPGSPDYRWRVEKRSLSDGNPVTAFGSAGIVTVDPGAGFDILLGIHRIGSRLYLSGIQHMNPPVGSDWRIRIEKRDTGDGALVTSFGTAGIVTENPSTALAEGVGILGSDSTHLYLGGIYDSDVIDGLSDQGWLIEKRWK